MPDLFDNFFNRFNQAIGGRRKSHYTGGSQVNTGSFYSYHQNATNNNYWLPRQKKTDTGMIVDNNSKMDIQGALNMPESDEYEIKPRMGSVASSEVDEGRSRMNSAVSES